MSKKVVIVKENIVQSTVYGILCFAWFAGIVIAKGFWSTLFALFPLWAWYLTTEKLLQALGWA